MPRLGRHVQARRCRALWHRREARLDGSPELLFKLRGVDETERLANADRHISLKAPCPAGAKVLDAHDADVLSGLDMAEQIRAKSPAVNVTMIEPRS
jgi:hypothetical protein